MLGPPKSTRSKARSNQKPMTAEVCIFLKSWDSSLLSEEGQGGQATSIVPDHRHLSHTHSSTSGKWFRSIQALTWRLHTSFFLRATPLLLWQHKMFQAFTSAFILWMESRHLNSALCTGWRYIDTWVLHVSCLLLFARLLKCTIWSHCCIVLS